MNYPCISLLNRQKYFTSSLVLVLGGLIFSAFLSGCGKSPTSDFSGTPAVEKSDSLVARDTTKPVDTLRVATFNMSIGFPVSQLLFTDMDDTAIAYRALDTLYVRFKHGNPSARIKIMATTIKDLDLDVIGLQEVMTLGKNGVQDNDFLAELIADITAAGGPAYQSYRNILNDTLLSGKLGDQKISIAFREGNALLIKPGFHILDTAKLDYYSLLQIPIKNARKSERCVNYLRMQSPKGIIWHVYNTHIEVFADIGNSQASELKKIVLEKGQGRDAQLVIGDFNSDPGKDAHQVMVEGGFLDTFIGVGIEPGATCCVAASALWDPHAGFSNRRIDYIFSRRIEKVLESHTALENAVAINATDTLFASDHRLVWARVVGQ